ncbi:hypothetical protein SADUNF_Sadunf07G0106900 [Salix dunnii]|uniref:Uncharacterized protein n=1 Tax=Salix dunnii TaxID=1413687 RepID=A0A835K011_9ROSI|nr:hypothetical protein SADUNF_Sadunf07G0106900 [Salix dunnii]
MTSINTLPYSSPPHFFPKPSPSIYTPPQNSFSTKRRRSRKSKTLTNNPNKPSSLDNDYYITLNNTSQNLKLVFDITQISKLPSSRFQQFLSLGQEAVDDLKTLVSLDENNRVVFSCQKSTLQFVGTVLLSGFLLLSSIRVLFKLVLGFKRKFGTGKNPNFVVRRDRSLGGKEVIVAVNDQQREGSKRPKRLSNPVEIPGLVDGLGFERGDWRRYRVGNQQKLPKWWLDSGSFSGRVVGLNQEEYQREANRLIRGNGKTMYILWVSIDVMLQLRRICRTSGVKASFNTTNTRDAFYRASIDVVLNVCSSAPSYSTSLEIDGEDPRHFIAGLAGNIGLESIRAARMVSAAVASRTRSCFLQAWALEVQGKHSEAVYELSKICLVLQTFPPEESSPEMEMVARGLARNLKVEQRELLMNMFIGVCSEESQRSAADALGLVCPRISFPDLVFFLEEPYNHRFVDHSGRSLSLFARSLPAYREIGLGLTGFGIFFSFLGIVFFFDKGLLAMGNILFISGVSLTIGPKSTMQFFMKRQNFKGTISFGVGFFFVVIGWPVIGMILEAYGFIVLFSGFWPTLAVFVQRIPILGWVFQQPFVRSIFDRYRSKRVPV